MENRLALLACKQTDKACLQHQHDLMEKAKGDKLLSQILGTHGNKILQMLGLVDANGIRPAGFDLIKAQDQEAAYAKILLTVIHLEEAKKTCGVAGFDKALCAFHIEKVLADQGLADKPWFQAFKVAMANQLDGLDKQVSDGDITPLAATLE